MMVKSYLLSVLYASFLFFVESHLIVRSFRKSQAVIDRTGYSETQSTRSKIQCAAACEQDDLCQKYSYDNNVCRMGESANGPGVICKSYDNCPTEHGYSIWAYDDMQLCLKYYSSEMNHAAANSTCGEDGAHLVLIESPAVSTRINEILSGLAVTGSLSDKKPVVPESLLTHFNWNWTDKTNKLLQIIVAIWLDGYDATSNTNKFLNWKGIPLAWIEWGGSNPHDEGGDECMMGKPEDGYKYRDYICNDKLTVLCQIDIM